MKAFDVDRPGRLRAFVVERRGRPRKRRNAAADAVFDVRAIAQTMPHRRAVPPALRHDARAECVLGVMAINGYINDAQYRAGVLLRECVQRYHTVMNVPRHNRGAIPLDGMRRGGGTPMADDKAQRVKDAHARACRALIKDAGVRGAQVVMHLAVYDQAPPHGTLRLARRGLTALVNSYRLTRGKAA